MADQKPDPDSNRTWSRAEDLAYGRGCQPWNECWTDCLGSARDAIVDGTLDERDRDLMRRERHRNYPPKEARDS